jgi:hypothetical protein
MGPPGCPSETAFFRAVALRTDRARLAAPNESARSFAVTVQSTSDGSVGTLRIVGTDGAIASRDVNGSDCAEVTSALTLIVALAIDPEASLLPVTQPPAPVAVTEPVPPATSISGPRVPPTTKMNGSDKRPRSLVWSLGADVAAQLGLVPAAGFGGDAFVDVAPSGDGAFVPSFRLAFEGDRAAPSFAGPIGATLTWWTARLAACPLRPRLGGTSRLALCGDFAAGVLRSRGVGLDQTATETHPWVASGVEARFDWFATHGLFFSVTARALVPLHRYPFYYQTPGDAQTSAYEMTAVSGSLDLGAGYAFR